MLTDYLRERLVTELEGAKLEGIGDEARDREQALELVKAVLAGFGPEGALIALAHPKTVALLSEKFVFDGEARKRQSFRFLWDAIAQMPIADQIDVYCVLVALASARNVEQENLVLAESPVMAMQLALAVLLGARKVSFNSEAGRLFEVLATAHAATMADADLKHTASYADLIGTGRLLQRLAPEQQARDLAARAAQ